MVVILDDEDRENEGDLIMAASKVRPEDINFMATHGRGLICLAITKERCQQLQLPLMVQDNQARYSTNFTVSIEASEGVTTGISAYDRAHTVRTAVLPDAIPEQLAQPGHIFPLMAKAGGVLTRAGHTEAGVDLVRLASLEPAAVLVEILNEDGSMARRPELEKFASKHRLKIGTVADLIRYRIRNEKTIKKINQRLVTTEFGKFDMIAYEDMEQNIHIAMVCGKPSEGALPLVRVHVNNLLSDLLAVQEPDFGLPLNVAMKKIAESGHGIVVVLGNSESQKTLLNRILQREELAETQETKASRVQEDLRTYGVGAQILADLGISKMRVLSAPKRFHGLSGFGLEVVEYVSP